MKIFLKHQNWIIKKLLLTFVAEDIFILAPVDLDRVLEKIHLSLRALPCSIRFVFHSILLLFQYGIPPLVWRWRPFTSLPLEKRLTCVATYEQSTLPFKRLIFRLLKVICLPALFSERELLIKIGYGRALQWRES